ncbi:MAG: hypothetical protein CMF58_02020 [Lentimicrobiaceae bacterium]|nr:hypothetical protein [Lentimicrobiaceae bacterium]
MLVFESCSTKKNTWTRRAYHNVTCHYNVYWNGMVSLGEGEEMLREKVTDDYNKVLRVYNYGTKEDAITLNPKMDRTIKKASIGIQRHSMTFGGKEYIKWVKDSYLMMGIAHFYKQDYTSARRVFDFVAKEFDNSPLHYEAILWLAKTYIQQERYEKAEASLNLLQSKLNDDDFPKSVDRELPLVYADFYIAKDDYNSAMPFLERGLELSNDHFVTTRIDYIIGQLNQMDNDYKSAIKYFKKVVKRNPPYKMAFEAQMNMAECYSEGSGDTKYINKVLKKMAKETKNKEYLDQIYYALAQIALSDGEDTLAINYLRKSVSTSVSDQVQKTTSSLQLADIYFDESDYNGAQAYYDTAAMSLPKDYPNYEVILNKTEILSQLVQQAQTITLQDSLQRLALMDTVELYSMIDKLIEEYEDEQERIAEEKENGGIQFVDMTRSTSTRPQGGGWYFDNTAALGRGRTEFIKKWGNRKLEDNWRLTDKRSMMQGFEENLTDEDIITTQDSTIVMITNPRDRQYYLQHIPRTPEQMAISDSLVIDAYNLLAYLYLEELRDTTMALDTYLNFQQNYPGNKYKLESWFALYKIYKANNDYEKSNYYSNLITSKYPESNYAKVIQDPDYFIKLSEQKNEIAKLYEKTFKAFNREQYYRVLNYSDRAVDLYPEDTTLVPKFLYLRAISLGAVNVADTMYASLIDLVLEYPSNSIAPLAKSVIKTLQFEYGLGIPDSTLLAQQEIAEKSIYSFNPDERHLVMILVETEQINISALKVRISDFDKKYFRLKRLRVKSLMLNNQTTIVTVSNFDSMDDAGNYLLALKNDEYVVSGLQNKDFEIYSISTTNYPIFYRDKGIKGYKEFFDLKYKRD